MTKRFLSVAILAAALGVSAAPAWAANGIGINPRPVPLKSLSVAKAPPVYGAASVNPTYVAVPASAPVKANVSVVKELRGRFGWANTTPGWSIAMLAYSGLLWLFSLLMLALSNPRSSESAAAASSAPEPR